MNTNRPIQSIKLILCGVLLIGVLFAPFTTAGIQKAHAQGIGGLLVQDIGSIFQQTLTALSSASLEQKELQWDGLFHDIATQALQQMTNDILEWANSGFDGEPAFITDLNSYLQDLDNDVAADFVYSDQFSEACTPLRLDAQRAIAEKVRLENADYGGFQEKAACTVDDIPGGNQGAFLAGEFTAGGWSMWFETVLNPVNTAPGLRLAGENALGEAQDKEKNAAVNEYIANSGFKSQKVCKNGNLDCTVTTPGSIIADQVSFALQIPALKLIQADEMNEVIGALFGDLANQAITGVNGLLGLGGNASFSANTFGVSGNLSYLDAIEEEQQNSTGSGQAGGNRIEQALRTETEVLELQLSIVTQLEGISSAFLEAREPYENDSCWDLEFPSALTDTLDELLEDVPTTIASVVALESLLEAYEESDTTQEQLGALQELSNMQREGQISGRTAVIEYEFYLSSELKNEIEDLEKEMEDQLDSC